MANFRTNQYDYRNIHGDTILTKFLETNRNDNLIIGLIRKGCDVNKSGRNGSLPLHLSMGRTSISVAHELIKNGANIDALDGNGDTALHRAVLKGNMEALCMLLHYGANVNITNSYNYTPLMWAFNEEEEEMAEILFLYYDDFTCMNNLSETALDLALWYKSPLALHLIQAGAAFSRCSLDNAALRASSYGNSVLFQIIWSKLDPSILLSGSGPFLINYMEICSFPVAEWLECLFMILSSPVAIELVQASRNYIDYSGQYECSVISEILLYCAYNDIVVDDRLALIYLCLSLGDVVNVSDIRLALQLYNFKEEVEALIYAGDFIQWGIVFEAVFPLPASVLVFQEETDGEFIFKLFTNLVKAGYIDDVIKALEYFSLPVGKKRQLEKLSKEYFPGTHKIFCDKLDQTPGVPSLLELSRNQARKTIKSTHRVQKAYQFHDAVKGLDVPTIVKDVLRFKTAVYRN